MLTTIINIVDKGYYCALTVSKEGAGVAKKFMHLKKQINDDVAVFEVKLWMILRKNFKKLGGTDFQKLI